MFKLNGLKISRREHFCVFATAYFDATPSAAFYIQFEHFTQLKVL